MSDRLELDVPAAVREKYGAIAKSVGSGACCGTLRQAIGSSGQALRQTIGSSGQAGGCCGGADPITSNLYLDTQTRDLPPEAVAASLGCGNPTPLLPLEAGQTVLDLGSGGGIDVLLSAKRVGPAGKVYGLDMTDEMLALARENQRKAGAANVEFLKGTIEAIPLPDNAVDVIISNCVINLSTDKDAVLREAFRVLKPGGRFAVSDIVVRGDVPAEVRRNMELWTGCIAGALEEKEYRSKLAAAGFVDIELDVWREYDTDTITAEIAERAERTQSSAGSASSAVDVGFASASVRALKPARACCDPGCCE